MLDINQVVTKRNSPFGRVIIQKTFQVGKAEFHRKSFLMACSDFEIRILKQNKNMEHVLIVDFIDMRMVAGGAEDGWRYIVNLLLYDTDTDQIMPFGHCLIQNM